jgi:primosomal protein N'
MYRLPCLFCALSLTLVLHGCSGAEKTDAGRRRLESSAPFVHVVLFKVKAEDRDAAAAEIQKDIDRILAPLPTVKGLWRGRPAPTNTRPIVDTNYDVGLLVLFEDQKGLQDYLDHPKHVEFAQKHDTTCEVRVFDFVPGP